VTLASTWANAGMLAHNAATATATLLAENNEVFFMNETPG
jgi:hypothetical protein